MKPNPQLDPSADRYGIIRLSRDHGRAAARGRALTDAIAPTPQVGGGQRRARPAHLGDGGSARRRVKVGGIDGPWLTVVGVVGDVRHDGLEAVSAGALYMTIAQWPDPETSCQSGGSRRRRPDGARRRGVRDLVREVDRDVPVSRVATMDDWISVQTTSRRFSAQLLGAFAVVALLLAALGVHGVVAMAVAARRRELGVRRALGSTDGGIVWLLLRQVLRMASVGRT